MMIQPITIEVLGIPQPAGSKRGFAMARKGQPMMKDGKFNGRVVVTDANKNSAAWKDTVANAAMTSINRAIELPFGTLLQGPLEVSMVFRMPRIKGHYKANGDLKPNAPARPPVRPDLLKLARGVEDALTGIIWRDDSQIVIERLEKVYAPHIFRRACDVGSPNVFRYDTKPGATITITQLETETAEAPKREMELKI